MNNKTTKYRLIKYWNRYSSGGASFSDCSTEYELLPVTSSGSSIQSLIQHAERLGLTPTADKVEINRFNPIQRALRLTDIKTVGYDNSQVPVYLGWIRIPEGSLEVRESLENNVTQDEAYEIISCQEYGMSDYGETVDNEVVLVKLGWDSYHKLGFAGYSRESFIKALGVTTEGFEDDTFRCSECGVFDDSSDCYTYNHRVVNDCELLGVNCGCFDEYCKSESGLDEYCNNSDKAIESNAIEAHVESGKLEFVERFVGGMTDPGRIHLYAGEHVRVGQPESILAELNKLNPDAQYIFGHDESGQFQTYFSVYKVIKGEV